MLVSMLAAVVLMADTPAAAEAPAQPAAPAAPPVSKRKQLAKKGMICHNEPVLGSKLPKRVCYTPEQAEERKALDRELTEYLQHSTHVASGN
jgi:hypothetical protein